MEENSLARNQELENVTTAYFLEDRIAKLRQDESQLRGSRPKEPAKPPEPQLKKVPIAPVPYPKINTTPDVGKVLGKVFNKKFFIFWGIVLILAIVGEKTNSMGIQILAGLGFIGGFFFYCIKIPFAWANGKVAVARQEEEQIRNSPEYINKCREIDEENRRRQEKQDEQMRNQYLKECENYKVALAKHEEDVKRYHEEILPAWSEEMAALQTALSDTQAALQELYGRNVIPAQYRNIPALYYLATFVGTSNYSLKVAIERYDAYVLQYQQRTQISLAQAQLMVMKEVAQNQQYTIWLNEQMAELLQDGSETLRSIGKWQKADISLRAYWRYQDRKAQKAKK